VALVGSPGSDCVAACDLTQAHLDAVRAKLREIRALERDLKAFVADCNQQCAGGPAAACVILEDLVMPKSPGTCFA
jgi:hypothetical protein